ncbi:MAG: DUF2490 domain-containing protein [Nitrospiraceae bacterium]
MRRTVISALKSAVKLVIKEPAQLCIQGDMDVFRSRRQRGRPSGLVVVAFVCTLAVGATSQIHAGSSVNQDFRLWSPVFLTVPLSKSFVGYMEVNPRFGDDVSELDQILLRPAIGYKLTDHLSIWQGYAWIGNYQPRFTDEHRVFQQLIYSRKFPSFKILSRSRLEERIIDNADGTAVRARTLLRADFPLPDLSNWAIVVFDEIFVNLNTVGHGPEAGLDQNRFFLGMNRRFTEQVNMDLGYQMQALNNSQSGIINQINHVILLQMFINL